MSNVKEKIATERLAKLIKQAKKAGQSKDYISPITLERVAEDLGLPMEKMPEILHAAEATA